MFTDGGRDTADGGKQVLLPNVKGEFPKVYELNLRVSYTKVRRKICDGSYTYLRSIFVWQQT